MSVDALRGERIKEERKRLGWSQQSAADAAGIRREMWAKYESGAEPGATVLAWMASAGVDVLYVLTGQVAGLPPAPDERVLLDRYRTSPRELRDAALRVLLGGDEKPTKKPSKTMVFNGDVGQTIEVEKLDQQGINFFSGKKK